jgi:inner membrane protein
MDSISQFVLGASVAEAFWGKRLGNKALLWGGFLGTLPDLDVIPGYWMQDLARIEFHRGPSHSMFLFALISYPLARVILKVHPKRDLSILSGALGVFFILLTHALLDMCTTWGTKLMWPFSNEAFAWQIVFVVDPLYTLPFLLFLFILLFFSRQSSWRWRLNSAALFLSTLYLVWCVTAKSIVMDKMKTELIVFKEPILRVTARPAPLSSLLWAITAETEKAYHCYYYSLYDTEIQRPMVFLKNHDLRKKWENRDDFQQLLRITQSQVLLKEINDGRIGLEVSDLRFGQIGGWSDQNSAFVFRYFLHGKPFEGRGVSKTLPRPSISDNSIFKKLWDRIWGIET